MRRIFCEYSSLLSKSQRGPFPSARAVNGQVFEHLHAASANRLQPPREHQYEPSRCGFSERHLNGRGEVIEPGTAVREFMWFEEWADWAGVEKHGNTW